MMALTFMLKQKSTIRDDIKADFEKSANDLKEK